MNFYCDESSQNAHRFLVLGSLAILKTRTDDLLGKLAAIRSEYKHVREVSWSSVSDYKYALYEKWLDVFSSFANRRVLRMTALVLDTHMPTNRGWDTCDPDLGFNKLIYQLLLHRVGKKYALHRRPIYGYLDSRTTAHEPEELRRILNHGLRKQFGLANNPFRLLVFSDSKSSDLIQLVDLVIGGLAFERNGHGDKPDARKAKIRLSERIAALQRGGLQFDIWNFRYNRPRVPRA
jgi:hypothetical protein